MPHMVHFRRDCSWVSKEVYMSKLYEMPCGLICNSRNDDQNSVEITITSSNNRFLNPRLMSTCDRITFQKPARHRYRSWQADLIRTVIIPCKVDYCVTCRNTKKNGVCFVLYTVWSQLLRSILLENQSLGLLLENNRKNVWRSKIFQMSPNPNVVSAT